MEAPYSAAPHTPARSPPPYHRPPHATLPPTPTLAVAIHSDRRILPLPMPFTSALASLAVAPLPEEIGGLDMSTAVLFLGGALFVLVAFAVLVWLLSSFLYVCKPNEILIFS